MIFKVELSKQRFFLGFGFAAAEDVDNFPTAVHEMAADYMFSVASLRPGFGAHNGGFFLRCSVYQPLNTDHKKRAPLPLVKIRDPFERQSTQLVSEVEIIHPVFFQALFELLLGAPLRVDAGGLRADIRYGLDTVSF